MGKTASHKIKDDYLELVKTFPLKNIRSDRQQDEAVRVLARLIGRVEALSSGETEYANALATLIKDYDRRQGTPHLPRITGLDVVRHLLAEQGLTQKQFGALIGVNESAASMILAGQRELTKSHILRLSQHFGLPVDAFF